MQNNTVKTKQPTKHLTFIDILIFWFKHEISKYPQMWLHERFFWLWLNNQWPNLVEKFKSNTENHNLLKLKIDYFNATRHPKLFAKLEFEKEIFKIKNQDLFNKVENNNKVTIKLLPKHKNKHL